MGSRHPDSISSRRSSPLHSFHPRPSFVPDINFQTSHSPPVSQNAKNSDFLFAGSENNKSYFMNLQDELASSNQITGSEHEFLHISNEFRRRLSTQISVVERPSSGREARLSVNEQERFYLQPKQFQKKPNWKRW